MAAQHAMMSLPHVNQLLLRKL